MTLLNNLRRLTLPGEAPVVVGIMSDLIGGPRYLLWDGEEETNLTLRDLSGAAGQDLTADEVKRAVVALVDRDLVMVDVHPANGREILRATYNGIRFIDDARYGG